MASDAQAERIIYFETLIRKELEILRNYKEVEKDILIVVHNQLGHLKNCINSIRDNTKNYTIYVWDNGSEQETAEWLREQTDLVLIRQEENSGFIIPNNRLVPLGKSPYIILLNSDTIVSPYWDQALIAHLQQTHIAQVGYLIGELNEECRGSNFGYGDKGDYIPGWCFCISRLTYEKYGLFDEQNLKFAYCEDADFSLRLQAAGEKIYALHLDLVYHVENATIREVREKIDCSKTFLENHSYMKTKWGDSVYSKLLSRKNLL